MIFHGEHEGQEALKCYTARDYIFLDGYVPAFATQ